MSNCPSDVLSIAAGEIGYDRHDDPEEGTKYGRYYACVTGSPYFGTTGVPYCAMFVSWCFAQAGASCAGLPAASSRTLYNDAKAAGRLRGSVRDAQPGDVLLWDWSRSGTNGDGDPVNLDHTCIGELNRGDDGMQTIEGNIANGKVLRRVRDWSYLAAVVAPDFDDAPVATPTPSDDGGIGNLDGETGDLLIDGYFGPLTIKYVQMALQRHGYYVGDLIDGDFGPLTTKELQRYLRYGIGTYQRSCDGDFGPYSVTALQQYLKNLGYYFDTDTADGSREWCSVDGDWGAYTTKALQRALNSGRF